MRGYLWPALEGVTDNTHAGGAVLVVTAQGDPIQVLTEHIQETATEEQYNEFIGNADPWIPDRGPHKGEETDPAALTEVIWLGRMAQAEEAIYIFPDAGCC
jgi:hypothetical protein